MNDRRRYRRMKLSKPCKVYDPRSRKYASGTTRDLSPYGVLVDLDRPVGLRPGDAVAVGIVVDDRHEILEAKDMAEGEVVRAMSDEDRTVLAVRFLESVHETATIRAAA